MGAQASLNSLKQSASTIPSLVPILNQAILDYDAAQAAWQMYHTALLSNPATPSTPVDTALTKVNSDLRNLSSELPAPPK